MGRYTWRQGAIIYDVHRRIEARARLTRLSVEQMDFISTRRTYCTLL